MCLIGQLIGLLLLIAVVIVVIYVGRKIYKKLTPLTVSFEGATIILPRKVLKEGDSTNVSIVIPRGYNSTQMTELGKALYSAVGADQYTRYYLNVVWVFALALFEFASYYDAEMSIDGEFLHAMDPIGERYGDQVPTLIHAIAELYNMDNAPTFTVPDNLPTISALAELEETFAVSEFQSCGEGGCRSCMRRKPTISRSRMQAGKGKGPTINTSKSIGSGYYAWKPRVTTTTFLGPQVGSEMRPAPISMTAQRVSPYQKFSSYRRPTQLRENVYETY